MMSLSPHTADSFATAHLLLLRNTREQKGGRSNQREAQSHVPIILSHICRARKLESKHKSMPTKRELYQRSNLFYTMGKPLADRKELCSPLHVFIWFLLVMQERKKKSLFSKVHRTAKATHHLWEGRRAHPGLRPCRALLIGPSVNIQQPGLPGSPSVALWSAVLPVWGFHPGNPHLASKWKNSLLCTVTVCLAESKAAMAAGFLYSHLKHHNYSPPRGKGKTHWVTYAVEAGAENFLPFSVFFRDCYFRAMN